MECDLDIFESKMQDVARALLKKECTLEDVLTDIKECGFGLKQSWEALEKSCRNLRCSKIKGRVGVRDSVCYIEVMLLTYIGELVLDVMSASLRKSSEESISNFFTSKIPKVVPKADRDKHNLLEEIVLVPHQKVSKVHLHLDSFIIEKMHLLLPLENQKFEGSELEVSLGPLSLDLVEKCWSMDLTFSVIPKGFLIPSKTKCVLVRFI
jgi:hypothetical protein